MLKERVRTFLNNRWIPLVFAFLISVFIVLAVRFFNVNDRVVTIPLDVTLPQSDRIYPISLVPETVDVVITGDDSVIYLVDPSEIKAVADFSKVGVEGIARRSVKLQYNNEIFENSGVTVSASPTTVRILFEETPQ